MAWVLMPLECGPFRGSLLAEAAGEGRERLGARQRWDKASAKGQVCPAGPRYRGGDEEGAGLV